MPTIYRIVVWPNHDLIQLKEATLNDIVYDDCIKRTKHDIDLARIHLFRTKQECDEQIQSAAKKLALAEVALEAKEQDLETKRCCKYLGVKAIVNWAGSVLFNKKDSDLKAAETEPESNEDGIEREEEDSELEDLRIQVEVAQGHYDSVQELFVWNMREARHLVVSLIQQLCRLVKEQNEQIKGAEAAVENTSVGQGTGDGV